MVKREIIQVFRYFVKTKLSFLFKVIISLRWERIGSEWTEFFKSRSLNSLHLNST